MKVNMSELPSYFRYWGKAEKDGSRYHLLVYHCLDVAAVGYYLLNPSQPLCQRLSNQLHLDSFWLQRWFTFCLTLHDVGKFATAFQGLAPRLSPTLVPSNSRMPYTQRHDTLGFVLWQEVLHPQWLARGGFDLDTRHPDLALVLRNIGPWMEVVTGHHGEPPKRTAIRHQNFFTVFDEQSASHFREDSATFLLTGMDASILQDKELKRRLKLASWTLAGVVVLADWLGSGRSPDGFCQDVMPLDVYWQDHAIPHAEQVLAKADLRHAATAPFSGICHLFPFISSLTPLQEWAQSRELGSTNQLFILEDVTGTGKTEAALVLAHRLMAAGLAGGIYVALPTMATANAMYTRLGKAYRRLFGADERPSLVLAHGARHLSEGFSRSVGLPESAPPTRTYTDDDEPAEAYCSAWLSDSRKKSLLADVGVGTLDQALLAVLPAKHQSLRLLGLSNKILVVDEVHSYDPYMNQLLKTLIEAHARQGGSVILLSATLPYQMRENYVRSFCDGAGLSMPSLEMAAAYPLATHVPTGALPETALEIRPNVERAVDVVMIEETHQALDALRQTVESGQCACWVRNTVKDARMAYQLLTEQEWLDKSKLTLFHSRFAVIDRQVVEATTLDLFNKDSKSEKRSGRVVVATQVVEQSLDLDFDVMISDLAPIDLLIQRAGRLHRHTRDAEGNPLLAEGGIDQRGRPCLYVLGPAPTSTPNEDWLKARLPGTQAIYQHVGQLWLTQQRLSDRFTMPDDARVLIEGVFGEDAQDEIPEALLNLCWNAEGAAGSKRGMALLNALKLEMGYTRASAEDSGGWDKETRIPTRLGDKSTTVALTLLDGGRLKPYAGSGEFAWELSMIDLPTSDWKRVKEKIPESLHGLIDELKEETKVLKWVEVLPLTGEIERYYDPKKGWGFDKEEIDESRM